MSRSSNDKHLSNFIKAIPKRTSLLESIVFSLEIQIVDMILGEKNKGMVHLMCTNEYSSCLNLFPLNSLHRHHPID
jgi:hypothetical protein